MKRATLLTIALALVGVGSIALGAGGQGGYRIYSPEGTATTDPQGCDAQVPLSAAIANLAGPFDNGAMLVARVVTHAELVVRKAQGANATNVQREAMADEKRHYLNATVAPLAGHAVSISFEVMDIVHRPAPVEPKSPGANATPATKKADAAAQERYEEERIAYGQRPMMVIGRIAWQSPTILGTEYRHAVADAKADAKSASKAAPHHARGDIDEAADARHAQADTKAKLVALREQADADRPVHMVYLLGSNDSFAAWKRGQTRTSKGVVQRVAAFVYRGGQHDPATTQPTDDGYVKLLQEDLSGAYVGLELVLIAAPDAP